MNKCWFSQVLALSAVYSVLTQSEQLLADDHGPHRDLGPADLFDSEPADYEALQQDLLSLGHVDALDAILEPAINLSSSVESLTAL